MELSNTGFWATVYSASRRLWLTFMHKPSWYEDSRFDWERTDLCTFVRTIFVWAPLTLVVNLATVAWALFALTFLGKALFPHMLDIGVGILIIAGGAILFAGTVALLFGTVEVSKKFANSETVRLSKEYLKAKKSSICPIIKFKETPDANA